MAAPEPLAQGPLRKQGPLRMQQNLASSAASKAREEARLEAENPGANGKKLRAAKVAVEDQKRRRKQDKHYRTPAEIAAEAAEDAEDLDALKAAGEALRDRQ